MFSFLMSFEMNVIVHFGLDRGDCQFDTCTPPCRESIPSEMAIVQESGRGCKRQKKSAGYAVLNFT
jgi:hypothetical protein